jgi:nucleotide-binding universal stress UspA family protein
MAAARYRIVIALDGSEYSEIVLEHALDQAARHDAPDLHVLAVVEHDCEIAAAKVRLATEILEGLATFRAGRPAWRTTLHVCAGKASEEIVDLAAEVLADLVVIGRYGIHDRHGHLTAHHGGRRRGSIADDVLERAPCPVLVVKLTDHPVEAQPQCPACVEIRALSDGARWFCAEHASDRVPRLTELVSGS